MRTYFSAHLKHLEKLASEGFLDLADLENLQSFGVTADWLAGQDETDPEVLADLLLQECATSNSAPFIIVAEIPTQEGADFLGQVKPTAALQKSMVAAYFAKDEAGELSWFGPTELQTLLESAPKSAG